MSAHLRSAEMASAYLDEGLSLSQVGERFGLKKQAVHAILGRIPGFAFRSPGFAWRPRKESVPTVVLTKADRIPSWRRPVRLACGAYQVALTQGLVTVFDARDLDLVAPFLWCAALGAGGHGYYARRKATQSEHGHDLYLHRLILQAGAGQIVDHRDGNKLNNRRSNIRICNAAENARNRSINRNNRSGYKGVHFSDGKFVAQTAVDRRKVYIGTFATAEEAALAYNERASQLHGDFAHLNDVRGRS